MAELFIYSLQSQPVFARTAVKVLQLRLSVTPEQGAKILQLCQGLQELALKIITDLPDDQNPLRVPLNSLQLTTLSLDLASAFYGLIISLADLPLLNCIERLHLTNGWVAMRGLYIGLPKLSQLMHVSFPVQPPGQNNIRTEILVYMLQAFHRLQVIILWCMPYQESQTIYDFLVERGILDRRVVVFNAARFTDCAQSVGGIWRLGEMVVQWREDRNYGMILIVVSYQHEIQWYIVMVTLLQIFKPFPPVSSSFLHYCCNHGCNIKVDDST